MTEKRRQKLVNRIIKKLEGAHLPAVAKETGLSYGTVATFSDADKRPHDNTVTKLAEYFGIE